MEQMTLTKLNQKGSETYLNSKEYFGPVTHHSYEFTNPQKLTEKKEGNFNSKSG